MTKEKGLPLTSTHWGTYRAKVKDGKVQELIGWEHDKDPSPIGPGILDVQDGPTRIDAPMIRKSWLEGGPGTRNKNRGTDSFVEVSWDKANQLVADELNRVKDKYGNSSIFGGSYGWASAGRFHHAQNGQISQGGTGHHYQKENILEAAKSGIEFINISPLKSDLIDGAKGEWIAARPNTDTALMLGLAHTLHEEGLSDKKFLETYTEGFDKFLPYLLGTNDGIVKNANWAAEICNIPSSKIIELARKISSKRTMISVSWSLTRQDHGEQPFWMAIMLASMVGQIGLPGGGFGFGYSATNYIGGQFTVLPGAAFPQAKNEIDNFIPVARISDLLLNPGKKFDFDGKTYEYPDIKIV